MYVFLQLSSTLTYFFDQWLFQVNVDDKQESLSKLFKKPKKYSPIFVYSAKIEEEGKNYGKATISNLEVIPDATGFIDDESINGIGGGGSSSSSVDGGSTGGNEITVQGPQGNPSMCNCFFLSHLPH